MQISTVEKTKVGGTEARGAFKMKASAKAFKILSDGLYQNKIRAVIRELSTNAVDALVEAGTLEKGFEVHIPVAGKPYFSIRDYGTGLAPEALEELYITYFDSTKTQSNDFTGCLGLGSKSPFSYTDSFSVTSFKDGKAYQYLAHLDSEGMPKIDQICVLDTEEDNGVLIRLESKAEDLSRWQTEAQNVYCWFEVLPKKINVNAPSLESVLVDYAKVESPEKGVGVYFKSKSNRSYDSVSHDLVMGNVRYPLPLPADLFEGDEARVINKLFLNTSILIKVPIGTCDVAASRESLSLDETTKRNLKKYIFHLKNHIASTIDDMIEGSTPTEGFESLSSLSDKFSSYELLSNKPVFLLNKTIDGINLQKSFPAKTKTDLLLAKTDPKLYFVSIFQNVSSGKFQSLEIKRVQAYNFDRFYSSFTSLNGNSKNILIFIDGEKPLIYDRVIRDFLSDYISDLSEKFRQELIKKHEEKGTNPSSLEMAQCWVRAYVVKAWENKEFLHYYKNSKALMDALHLRQEDIGNKIFFVSDFCEKYKKAKKNKSTKVYKKKKEEEFTLLTKSLSRGNHQRVSDLFQSIDISTKLHKDVSLYYTLRRSDNGVLFMDQKIHYSFRDLYALGDLLIEDFKGKRILSLTEGQLKSLEKRKFKLIEFSEALSEKVKEKIETYEAKIDSLVGSSFYSKKEVALSYEEEEIVEILRTLSNHEKEGENTVKNILKDLLQLRNPPLSLGKSFDENLFQEFADFKNYLSSTVGVLRCNRLLSSLQEEIEKREKKLKPLAPPKEICIFTEAKKKFPLFELIKNKYLLNIASSEAIEDVLAYLKNKQ